MLPMADPPWRLKTSVVAGVIVLFKGTASCFLISMSPADQVPLLSTSTNTSQPPFQLAPPAQLGEVGEPHTAIWTPRLMASLRARLISPIKSLVSAVSRFDSINVLILGTATAARTPIIVSVM